MVKRLTLLDRHWATQALVTAGATAYLLMAYIPEVGLTREYVAYLTTLVWVWGP